MKTYFYCVMTCFLETELSFQNLLSILHVSSPHSKYKIVLMKI